jgi:CubicO group peptidase (beta-lactamase class C family)
LEELILNLSIICTLARKLLHLPLTIATLAAFGHVVFAQPSQKAPEQNPTRVELPNTTLGKIMSAWFAAIDSGKEEDIKHFVERYLSANALRYQRSASEYAAFFRKLHQQSGGLEIVQVTRETGVQPISIIAKSRRGNHYARIQAGLDGKEPDKLAGLGVDKSESPNRAKLADTTRRLSEAQLIAAIKSELDRRSAAGAFSGVVLIAKGDRILLNHAYGMADRDARIPNRLNTKFHIASVGKMFTAVAIAQLVNSGKLSYSDTVGKVLPDYPNNEVANKVTIHQLLTHSAGMGTFFESPGFVPGRTYPDSTSEIVVYKDEKLFFEPGTRWRYSNAGYSLLGAIVERLSGKTYREYVREHIFKPLGMRDTYTNSDGKVAPNTSVFYRQSPDDPLGLEAYLPDKNLGTSPGTGFGGGFSTAMDLFKFLRAYRNESLVGSDMTQQMVNSKINVNATGALRYAYGIEESTSHGVIVRGHSGGSRTNVQMLWDEGYTVIFQSNAIPPPVNNLSAEVVDFLAKQSNLRRTPKLK